MSADPRRLKLVDLCRLLNSTPLGEVIQEHQLKNHRNRAGLRIGDSRRIDLVKYVAWLVRNATSRRPRRPLRSCDDTALVANAQGAAALVAGPRRRSSSSPPSRRRAIAALLSTRSYAEAAERAGVSEVDDLPLAQAPEVPGGFPRRSPRTHRGRSRPGAGHRRRSRGGARQRRAFRPPGLRSRAGRDHDPRPRLSRAESRRTASRHDDDAEHQASSTPSDVVQSARRPARSRSTAPNSRPREKARLTTALSDSAAPRLQRGRARQTARSVADRAHRTQGEEGAKDGKEKR